MTRSYSIGFSAFLLALLLGTSPSLAADVTALRASPRTGADIVHILTSRNLDPKRAAELHAMQEILDSLPPQTSDRMDLARFFIKKADAAGEMGALQLEARYLAKGIELWVAGDEDGLTHLGRLSNIEAAIGNMRQAITYNKRTVEAWPRGRCIETSMLSQRAYIYAQLGDFDAAQQAMRVAETDFSTCGSTIGSYWGIYRTLFEQAIEGRRSDLLYAQGKPMEAEAALRKAVEASREDVFNNRLRRTQRMRSLPEADLQRRWEMHESKLAILQSAQGRLAEAEATARDVFYRAARRTGGDSLHSANVLESLISVMQIQGRYKEVEQIATACLANLIRDGVPGDALIVIHLRGHLAESLAAQTRYAEAIAEYQKRYDALAPYPDLQRKLASGDISWALALVKTGKPDESLSIVNDLMPRSQQWLGEKHLQTTELVGVKAMALAAKGDKPGALDSFRKALPVLLAAAISEGDEPSPLRSARIRLILEAYLGLLGEIRGTPIEVAAGLDATSEAFRLADALRNQSTQGAVAASAARAAANDPKIGVEIRKEQDLTHEMVALHKVLRDLMTAPADQQLPKVIADMRVRIETLKKDRIALQADIEKRFPAYANLIRPQPPSLAEARAILRPGEALINILASDSGAYVWAFKKDGPVAFVRSTVTREDLAKRVQTLRRALDPGDVDLTTGIPDFDLDTAHRLYTDLLSPVSSGWQGATHLLVVANGSLGQLPLAVLPTAKAAVKQDPKLPYAKFREVPWLIHQAALTQLPSVNALVALRKLPVANAQRSAFVGFGDPQFTAEPVQLASNTRRLRNLEVSRPSQAEVEQVKPVEWMDYGKIPPLPDTREEILALAQALKADRNTDVFLGSQASRANVKKLDLSNRRVVAFATHGLLAGDFPGVSEPSLALANPGGGKHGLLTLEDILGLKLDADWVVLSACNTAGGDGQGADALSGLGRGFFYAGSRALLVTHWPVESVSARLLVTGLFERQAADAKLSRTEALRQSMLALMQQNTTEGNFAYAHPLFWAPYALVGEGGI